MAMEWSNPVYGNRSLQQRAFFFQNGVQPLREHMVEVRLQVSTSRFHQWSHILPFHNQVDIFGFLFPLSHLFSYQLRQVQVQHMLSHVRHPCRHDLQFWSHRISWFALRAARTAVLAGRSGFFMDVGISIRMVDWYPWSVLQEGSGESDDHDPVTEILMRSLEESGSGGGEFGGIPASKSSVNALETRSFEGKESTSACAICLEDLEAGVEVTAMPCSHEFHRTCLSKWLEQSHLCPLCRFPMPTEGSRVPQRVAGVGQ